MSLFNLSGIVARMSTHTLTLKRPNAVTFATGGFASAQTFVTSSIPRCAVQPGKSADLSKAPEGTRAHDVIVIFSPTELEPRDRVTVPGRGDFEVFNADAWAENGSYCRALALKLDASEPRA